MTATTVHHRATFEYYSHHSAHHSSHYTMHHSARNTAHHIAPHNYTTHHSAPQFTPNCTTHHSAPTTRTTAHHAKAVLTLKHRMPGVLVLQAEAVAHCGELAPMVQVKNKYHLSVDCCISLSILWGLVTDCWPFQSLATAHWLLAQHEPYSNIGATAIKK